MNILKLILKITNQLRPILLKVFPYNLLRKFKELIIKNSFKKLKKINKQNFK